MLLNVSFRRDALETNFYVIRLGDQPIEGLSGSLFVTGNHYILGSCGRRFLAIIPV